MSEPQRWKVFADHWMQEAGGPIPFALRQWEAYRPIFECIRRNVPAGGRILDVGCGTGTFTALLSHFGYEVVGIDSDADVVGTAREMATFLHSSARMDVADGGHLDSYYGSFDLVFSLGVLEHFTRDTTIAMVKEQARCASKVLVVMPTRFTRYAAPITDERIYTRRQLNAIVRDADLRVAASFVYGQIPTRAAINFQRLLPKVIYRPVNHLWSWGMGIASLGVRVTAGP